MTLIYRFSFHMEDVGFQKEYFWESEEGKAVSGNEVDYINNIADGVIEHIDEIDSLISNNSKDWKFDHIPRIDISVLRLCIYEMLYRKDIPSSVSINEAVDLAKKFGHDDSSTFVNGILGSIYRQLLSEGRLAYSEK